MQNNIDPSTVVWDDEKPDPAAVQWDDAPVPAKPKPTTSFMERVQTGVMDPIVGAGQIVDKLAGYVPLADSALKGARRLLGSDSTMTDVVNQRNADYQAPEGVDWARMGGNVLNPVSWASPGAGVARMAAGGAAQAALAPVDNPDNFWSQKGVQTATGAAMVPALTGALKLIKNAPSQVLGAMTGAGAESVKQAYRNAPGFVENMRGAVQPGAVVEQARAGIQNLRDTMHSTYQANKANWNGGQQLSISPVWDAYMNLSKSFGHEGFGKIGPAEERVVQEIQDVIVDFAKKPNLHTTEGFDALKQRLQAIYPENPQMTQAQRAVSTMSNAVKDVIVKENPLYAKAMKDYWLASSQLSEIEKSLSLGSKATTDTALRKLQSLMRNNVNSNFGQRVNSANILATQGGEDVLPAVAGQAMNSWTPRGLQGAVASGTGIASLTNPSVLAALPAMSPRLVGEVSRGVGMVGKPIGKVVDHEATQALIEALRRGLPAMTRGLIE